MNELDAASKHIFDTLVADDDVGELVADRIYYAVAPGTAVYPFVLYNFAGGPDRQVAGADQRMITRPRWLVLAVHNENDIARTRAIASAVDNALTGSSNGGLVLDGVTYAIQTVRREEPVEQVGEVDDTIYLNAGGYYRTPCQKLP